MNDSNQQSTVGTADGLVIIPTYKEEDNAAAIIDAVMRLPQGFDVLVIDDNSPDRTAAIVREKMAEYPGRVHGLHHGLQVGS